MPKVLSIDLERIAFALILSGFVGGCSQPLITLPQNIHHSEFVRDFEPSESARIRVGEISDVDPRASRDAFPFPREFIVEELRNQIEARLLENGMLATGSTTEESYVVSAEITDYHTKNNCTTSGCPNRGPRRTEEGAPTLLVRYTIHYGGEMVGTVESISTLHTYPFLLSPVDYETWRSVFKSNAENLVEELKAAMGGEPTPRRQLSALPIIAVYPPAIGAAD